MPNSTKNVIGMFKPPLTNNGTLNNNRNSLGVKMKSIKIGNNGLKSNKGGNKTVRK